MKPSDNRIRDEAMVHALDEAIVGRTADLFDRLRRASGLPGPRPNTQLLRALAGEIGARGAAADKLVAQLLTFDLRSAPYGHVDEFLAIAGIVCLGERGLVDVRARDRVLRELASCALDERMRIRTEVAAALGRIAGAMVAAGEDPLPVLESWLDDDEAWLGAAVIEALRGSDLSPVLSEAQLGRVLEVAFARLGREHRAGRRQDAWHRFSKSLGDVPVGLLSRHPKLAQVLVAEVDLDRDVEVRAAIEVVVTGLLKSGGRAAAEPIEAALRRTKKKARDPRSERIPKRGR